jgi:proline iminopeptidase
LLDGIVGIAAIGATVLFSPLLRPWYVRWGATKAEASRRLAGDDLVPRPKSQITCARSISTSVEGVWPWLVQLGCQRAGWYSYDLLDNGGVPSAARILPEHQQLAPGNTVLLTPDGRLGYPVVVVEAEAILVLGGMLDTRTGGAIDPSDPLPEAYFGGSNVFVLEGIDDGSTRLIFRQRLDWNPTFANRLIYRVFLEPIAFVMARKMIKGIQHRAEA